MVKTMSDDFLDGINKPDDIKNINKRDLPAVAVEIRRLLISCVSNNGGHLASNLGVVELTIALLRVFDPGNDKLIWDVGHQSYTYKILTGRKDLLCKIRQKDGLAGFPKRNESKYDFFNTGHSSTSVSAALGFARAAKIKEEDSYAIAVVGDGAMTGGMVYEAMNDAGASGEKIIVVLNDNEMSITRNVGGVSEYFSRMRSNRIYSGTNNSIKKGMEKVPFIGGFLAKRIHHAKSAIKYLFSQNMLFEEMGFQYLGPVDGHDIKKMESLLEDAKKIKGPVLVHVVTVKGKGYDKAERKPEFYHGVSSFDIENGIAEKKGESFSSVMGSYLLELAKKDKDIVTVCPAVTLGCGLIEFSEELPENFYDVGIAEQHAVTMAAGMSCNGMKSVVSSYSTFMQRAYDQILHDVCLMNLNVMFTFDRAGLVEGDGETHQGIYDLAYLSNMPNIQIYAPADFSILKKYMHYALYERTGPSVIRYPKGKLNLPQQKNEFEPNKINVLKEGTDCIIFSYGRMLEESVKASDLLNNHNIACSVVDLSCLKPLDYTGIIKKSKGKKAVFCVEDVVDNGSCSMQISKIIAEMNPDIKFLGINLPETFDSEGTLIQIL